MLADRNEQHERSACALWEQKGSAGQLLVSVAQEAEEARRIRRVACQEMAQTHSEVKEVAQQASTQIAVRASRWVEASVALPQWELRAEGRRNECRMRDAEVQNLRNGCEQEEARLRHDRAIFNAAVAARDQEVRHGSEMAGLSVHDAWRGSVMLKNWPSSG